MNRSKVVALIMLATSSTARSTASTTSATFGTLATVAILMVTLVAVQERGVATRVADRPVTALPVLMPIPVSCLAQRHGKPAQPNPSSTTWRPRASRQPPGA